MVSILQYREFYRLSRAFAEVVISEEYGMTPKEKLAVAHGVCDDLAAKILDDLLVAAGVEATGADFGSETAYQLPANADFGGSRLQHTFRNVRSRLFFTSESHIHGSLAGVFF
jgi:hypothetical protein